VFLYPLRPEPAAVDSAAGSVMSCDLARLDLCYDVSMIGLLARLLPDIDTPPPDGEHDPLVFQEPDGPGDHVLAHAVGLLECPVRRQRTTGPFTCGYPAADDFRELEIRGNRAPMINFHPSTVRQGKTALACGYPYPAVPCLALPYHVRLVLLPCNHGKTRPLTCCARNIRTGISGS